MEKNFSISKEQYFQLTAHWANQKQHSSSQHLMYNILRSKDPRTGFSARQKNIQGNDPWFEFKRASSDCISRYFKYVPFPNKDKTPYLTNFKNDFGIDMPENLWEIFKEAK